MQPAVQCQERVEQRGQVSEMRPHILPHAMEQVLEMAHIGQHRQDRLQQHALVPGPPGTELEVLWNPLGTGEAGVGQGDRLALEGLNHRQELLIMDVGRVPIPGDYFAPTVDQPTELDPHDPAIVGFALLPQLLRAAALAPGMDQFDAVAVNDGEEGGVRQEGLTPGLVGLEQPLQARALGQRKPGAVIPCQPAIEGAELDTLEGEEQTNSHQFAGIEVGLRVFGQVADPVIYQAEERDDKIQGGHGFCSSSSVSYDSNCEQSPWLFQLAPVVT